MIRISLLIVLLLCSACALHGQKVQPYLEGGLSVHDQAAAYPEEQWPEPVLGYVQAGVERNGWSVYIEHESCPGTTSEKGWGRNSVGVSKRLYLFEGP